MTKESSIATSAIYAASRLGDVANGVLPDWERVTGNNPPLPGNHGVGATEPFEMMSPRCPTRARLSPRHAITVFCVRLVASELKRAFSLSDSSPHALNEPRELNIPVSCKVGSAASIWRLLPPFNTSVLQTWPSNSLIEAIMQAAGMMEYTIALHNIARWNAKENTSRI